ncbi:MAG: triose-phosphate isomerase [Candidatus Diapherotrites archaeon]|nr:triose-phosphate isomerase [Candidatus Diapherotrites archaeon]MDZ4256171.1 triose-phosphate isomerase [archaeon]
MRPKVIVGNWKMNLTIAEGKALAEDVRKYSQLHLPGTPIKVVLCPPFTHLIEVGNTLKESEVDVGAQDCHYENFGPYTGDISAAMLAGAGCRYCILGHSERRAAYKEPGRILNAKVLAVLRQNMIPIFCIGETLEEKNAGKTNEVLAQQMKEGLAAIPRDQIGKIILAYEPVWAISTSKDNQGAPATPAGANTIHQFIREQIKLSFGNEAAQGILILYGGSVKSENARGFLIQTHIDGCLVGGASLKKDSFCGIIDAANIPQ